MPRVDDQPTEVTPETGPDASTGSGLETRVQRRARLQVALREPLLPPLATVLRPVTSAASIIFAALLVLAVLADPVLMAAGLAWAGLVIAWGWPALTGSSSRFGSSLSIGIAALLVPAAAAATTEEPYLRYVPVALALALAVMFGHQIMRRDGRPRLTDSLGSTSLAIAVVTMGVAWMPLSRTPRGTELAVVALVSIGVASLGDLAVGFSRLRAWSLPLAMVLGGGAAIAAAAVVGSPGAGSAALVGLLCAAVSHSLRRVLSVLPAITSIRGQLASAAAGLLVPGVIGYVLALAIVG